jgi:uncharacterized protein involved in exopolysaccharide biosynthesis
MQPQEQNVARRPLDVEDYIDILRRHKSWIFGPTFAALVVATVVAFLWPDTYVSTGVVRVVPPKVPESYVPSNLNSDLQGRFNSMLQGVLNKQHLQAIITEFDLYKKDLKRLPMEDVYENMRVRDIKIAPVSTIGQVTGKAALPAFQIGFAYQDRRIAQKVAQKIISDLMSENLKETNQVTQETTEFMQNRREGAKKKLDAFESRLSDFRQRHLKDLPEQQQTNFNQLTVIQTQVLNLNTSMSRVNQDKVVLENQMRILKDELSQLKDPGTQQEQAAATQKSEKLQEKEREVAYYEAGLQAARERYKDSHPDVQAFSTKLATAKRQRDEIIKEDANKKPEVVVRPVNVELIRQQRDHEAAIKRVQGVMEAKDLEMQDYQKQAAQLTTSLRTIQERLAGMPIGLKEYEELMRDRDLAKKEYEELDKKVSNSLMSTAVISNNQGESLEQIEQPNIPETPTEPKRPVIILAGMGIGLILGLFLTGAREVKDSSLKNLKDVRAYTQLPILGSIPLLENDLIVRRRRRLAWLAWATACLIGVVVMSSSVVYYYATRT